MTDGGLVVAKLAAGSVVSYLKALSDPNKRRLLDEQTIEHVLEELPRIVRLLEERCQDLEARGCTHVEANIIAQQVIEAQTRTRSRPQTGTAAGLNASSRRRGPIS